ncbi:MAG: proprotein convertase P-domain-containing protein [Calditrichota bacterium]
MKVLRGWIVCLLVLAGTAWVRAETFVSTDVPVAIPDGPSGIAQSFLTITENREILDLNITVWITHPFVGDLRLYLEGPDETVRRLANRCGHDGNNYTATCFDDTAAVFICDGDPPYTGRFEPDQHLIEFDGLSTQGTWIFRVTDNASGDVGTITAWQLNIVLGDTLDADDPVVPMPREIGFTAVYPNPFNATATIAFSVPQPEAVKLTVYDILGQVTETLTDQFYTAGDYRLTFDGARLPSGLYFARLETDRAVRTCKIVLMK